MLELDKNKIPNELLEFFEPAKCGECYVCRMVEVFREVKRVLKKEGTLFLNLGDSYYGSGKGQTKNGCDDPKRPKLHGMKLPVSGRNGVKYDNGDKAKQDSLSRDSSFQNEYDEHKDILQNHNLGILCPVHGLIPESYEKNPVHKQDQNDHFPIEDFSHEENHISLTKQDSSHFQDHADEQVSSSSLTKQNESYQQRQAKNHQSDNPLASLNEVDEKIHDENHFSDKKVCICDIVRHLDASDRHKLGIVFSDLAYLHSTTTTLKSKDLVGIPWRVAFALQADGWWLRQDIIWCLSGGTYVYAKTQKGTMPVMIRDLARLKPNTIQLWNGKQWTKVLGISKSKRNGYELELVLRSGERISCTPNHKFPTKRGLIEAGEIIKGDILISTTLPESENPRDCVLDEDAGWFAGLYIAEGSCSNDCIQIAGHSKEKERWERLQEIAKKYGGHITRTVDKNNMSIRLYGKILNAIIDELISGRIAKDKGFANVVWNYSNSFIRSMINGYLSGDGHWDKKNNRWRLGFTRNYNLERDLRTACARLGWRIVLNLSSVKYNGKSRSTFRGEIREGIYREHKNKQEIVAIRKARCREVYDIGVEDEPHLFTLASGILTHNSKPNPMPESVTDRCTKAHEYIFLLTKSPKYFFDNEAIKEPATYAGLDRGVSNNVSPRGITPFGGHKNMNIDGKQPNSFHVSRANGKKDQQYDNRNKRSVWTVNTKPFKGAHFATFPETLIGPMVKAGCPKGGIILDPFMGSGTTALVARQLGRDSIGIELNPNYIKIAEKRLSQQQLL